MSLQDGLTTNRRLNVESRQKLAEKLYRDTPSAKRLPNIQQQQLNRAYNKPSAKSAGSSGTIKGSKVVQAKSTVRGVKAKYAKDLSRAAKQTKAAPPKIKAAAAKNISKFGDG